jgi:uncharacterized protein with GYD domain
MQGARAVLAAWGRLGSVESALEDADVYAIVDLPDSAAAAALSLTISGSGVASVRTVALLTPEELDRAAQLNPDYAPGLR